MEEEQRCHFTHWNRVQSTDPLNGFLDLLWDPPVGDNGMPVRWLALFSFLGRRLGFLAPPAIGPGWLPVPAIGKQSHMPALDMRLNLDLIVAKAVQAELQESSGDIFLVDIQFFRN